MSKYNLTEIFNESFDSLAKKLDKQKGIDKDDAAKIAGSIAAKKMKGAGSGPTAKQKARVKEEEMSDAAKALLRDDIIDVIEIINDSGKDNASDFMDAIGEEFDIDFEYGRVNEQSKPIKEDNFDELKKHQEMMKVAADFFRDKAEELDVDTNKIMDFNKGVNDLVQDVFDADYKRSGGKIDEDLFSKDGGSEDNVDNIDRVSSPSTKGVGYDQVSKANTAEDDMESKETLNPKPMFEDLKKHFKRFI